ncbi:hypothetical protein AYI68_g7933 [Smittium mucronatum]|uniref:Uncharacterized protein n=1 Tax=Smittium mucronatum TaxID=133383 RepID=A0A1R0GMD4_9FUNG|nr:hypothetical protein AYI68_g7933 [Smittium mucronatum]
MIEYLAAQLTQSRQKNSHTAMYLSGKAPQVLIVTEEPLWDNEHLENLITGKKAEKNPRTKKPFRQRQQNFSQRVTSFNSAQEQTYEATVTSKKI